MTTLSVNPIDNPGAFDALIAGGVQSPGIFRLQGGTAARVYKIDVRDPNGVQGAIITYRGWRPTDGIKGTFFFWERDQIDKFYREFLPIWMLDAKKYRLVPVTVSHPSLEANGITALVCKQIGDLTSSDGNLWSVSLEWVEYRVGKRIDVQTATAATGPLNALDEKASAVRDVFKRELATASGKTGTP